MNPIINAMQNSHSSQLIQNQINRRALLTSGLGGALISATLGWFSARQWNQVSSTPNLNQDLNKTHHLPTAKRVLFLFMPGGPSQLDLFDPKPELETFAGQLAPEDIRNDPKQFTISHSSRLWPSPRKFAPCGESGIELSDLIPHHHEIADDLCLIRSVQTDSVNHDPAQLLLMSGVPSIGRPSMGSWISYGLGAINENLPTFVVLNSGQGAAAGANNWSSGFLSKMHAGVPFRNQGDPILYLSNPRGITQSLQRSTIDSIHQLNQQQFHKTNDQEIESRMAAYELAYQMQLEAPSLVDFSDESEQTLNHYGIGTPKLHKFGFNCLMARRLLERGTRCVMLVHGSWDDHKNLNERMGITAGTVDQPGAALIKDLKERGLLEDTLVIWGGEFGRTPTSQMYHHNRPDTVGRDHHASGFSMWLAGGGIKAGTVVGRTDELGLQVVEQPIHIHDLQATILHCLGFDHLKLTHEHLGRDLRLTDTEGQVVKELLA